MNETTVVDRGMRLDFAVIDARCAELGATTESARAELLTGTVNGRSTLWRWRNGTADIGIDRARQLAVTLGLPLTEILIDGAKPQTPVKPQPRPKPPSGPGKPTPPAGPRRRAQADG